jgi:primosomal protein N' (replication factor Y)
VTGSGKTLVYIELLRHVVRQQGRGAIVLVPEIALTPQTVARFRAEFGDVVAVLHSALSDGERFDAWRALRTGSRRIAIGARSAIFAPVPDLGAIIVDEEHEASYKQSEAPRYHARELAVVRAANAGAVCVLGSATPSLESWSNTLRGKYRLLELPERVEGRPLPPVSVVDLRGGKVWEQPPGMPDALVPAAVRDRVLAPVLVAAIAARLDRGEQTILLLNRRGYSSFVQCRNCGHVWHCPDCNVSLTYHRSRRRMVCHYCCHDETVPERCDACGAGELSRRGVGTEQVERAVADTFPQARIARMDVDTTSGKWAHHQILERVGGREIDILLGTQMIAKGLDFPGVTLVGVVNADVAMNLPDFRASERTFQLLTQVAGRAGRGPAGGEVLVQTSLPSHYAIRAAIRHDYREFAARELEERRAPAYPPHERLVNVVVSGTAELAVQDAAQAAADEVARLLAQHRVRSVVLTGPAPCPIDRIRGRWRWHFLLRSATPGPLGAVCRHLQLRHDLPPGRAELRIIVDRDPVNLL